MAVGILQRCVDDVAAHPLEVSEETYGVDPLLAAHLQYGLSLWFLGRPDQARAHVERALTRAEGRQPFDRTSALCQAALLLVLCGDASAASRLASQAETLCTEHEIAYFLPGAVS